MPARRSWSPSPGSTGWTSRCSSGIDLTRDILIENTERFARGLPANNALLWGARGMGKSSLVKAAHHAINEAAGGILKLVEIHREDIESLPLLMNIIRAQPELPLHRVLRRPLLRCRRHLLQVAEGRTRRRHRGPALQHDLLRHLEPPPPAAARHDRERALDRHQPVRGGAGEGLAVRPLRPVARLPQLLAGRVPGDDRRLCEALSA